MSEYLDYLGDVEDAKDKINDLALKMYQRGKADAIEEALMLCTYSIQLNNGEYDKGFEDGVALVRKRLEQM